MIGRLPHPWDANRPVYVSFHYSHPVGEWQPLRSGYYDTELDAVTACAHGIMAHLDELHCNMNRLATAARIEDIIRIGGTLHELDMTTGYLKPVDEPAAPSVARSPDDVFVEEVMATLERVREQMRSPVTNMGLVRAIAHLSKRLFIEEHL